MEPQHLTDRTAAPKPTIGRIVLYQRFGTPGGEHKSEASPAIITQVLDDIGTCELFVMNPRGTYHNTTRFAGAEPKPGCWHWPPRV